MNLDSNENYDFTINRIERLDSEKIIFTVSCQIDFNANHKVVFIDEIGNKEYLNVERNSESSFTFIINKELIGLGNSGTFYVENKELTPIFIDKNLEEKLNGFEYKLFNKSHIGQFISVESILRIEIVKIPKNLCYIKTVEINDNQLVLSGFSNKHLYKNKNNISFLIRERNSKECTYESSISFISSNEWEAKVSLDNLNIGIWDFYFLMGEKEIRIKSWNNAFSELHYINQQQIINQIKPYMTVKGSFSIVVNDQNLKLNQVEIKNNNKLNVDFKASVNWSHSDDIKTLSIVFRNKSYKENIEFPLEVKYLKSNQYTLSASINYEKFIELDFWPSKWHAYIKYNNQTYRINVDNELFKEDSNCFNYEHMSQLYFYQTINGNLSLNYEKIKLQRDIEFYKIKKNFLELKGYVKPEIGKLNSQAIKRELVIKLRNTDVELTYDLIDIDNFGSFEINIDLNLISKYITVDKVLFDFYYRYSNEINMIEKKLGFEEYDFKKDGILEKDYFKTPNGYVYSYLCITPHGNLKLDAMLLDRKKHYYLKYKQHLDVWLNRNRDVWLVGERPDTAQDTGYHFFKYCREKYPEKEVYYVIQSDSKDRKNIEHLGNVVELGSYEHFKLSAIAKKFIGSHDLEYFLPVKPVEFTSYKKGTRVFLQHGVLGRRKVEYYKRDYIYPFHLFCVSSDSEKELVMHEMGYSNDEVIVTGLTRFDALLDQNDPTDDILLIPSWRPWLNNNRTFTSSEYFKRYHELLSDQELHSLLEKHNLTLNFYPHYRIQPYITNFREHYHNRINILKLGEMSVQQLLKNHRLMITDYSSVSMDFNYMNKPVIFYHFDFKKYFKDGSLRKPEETFIGDIVQEKAEMIQVLERHIQRNFIVDKKYVIQKQHLFKYEDTNNCKRVFKYLNKKNTPSSNL